MTTQTSAPTNRRRLFKHTAKTQSTYLIRCPESLMARVRTAAKNRHETLAAYVRAALVRALIADHLITNVPEAYQ